VPPDLYVDIIYVRNNCVAKPCEYTPILNSRTIEPIVFDVPCICIGWNRGDIVGKGE